jgi:hypothetical protein
MHHMNLGCEETSALAAYAARCTLRPRRAACRLFGNVCCTLRRDGRPSAAGGTVGHGHVLKSSNRRFAPSNEASSECGRNCTIKRDLMRNKTQF